MLGLSRAISHIPGRTNFAPACVHGLKISTLTRPQTPSCVAGKANNNNNNDHNNNQNNQNNTEASFAVFAVSTIAVLASFSQIQSHTDSAETDTLVNFSGTHQCTPSKILEPNTTKELEEMVAEAHKSRKRVRVVGTGLSPNGLGFSDDVVLSLANCDRVIKIDVERQQITVEAGATVEQVLNALRPHNLTLQNLASINAQQIGGFIQVSAHGTGAKIPPVDEQVVSMRLVTPALGSLFLSREVNSAVFEVAKVGLGAVGVVSEVTLQCVPAHKLVERTFVQTVEQTRLRHNELLAKHRHLRYMWIPWTDTVVVVASDPVGTTNAPNTNTQPTTARKDSSHVILARGSDSDALLEASPVAPLVQVYRELGGAYEKGMENMGVAALRDKILALNPLNLDLVKRLNRAEAQTWKNMQGVRVADNDRVLAFDCGGQQWVWECCFNATNPLNKATDSSVLDIDFVTNLLKEIEKSGLPAHSPIEHRWTSPSSALLSPAHSKSSDDIFSWVGIILYIPTLDKPTRAAISREFEAYQRMVMPLLEKVGGTVHWAKLEVPKTASEQEHLRQYLKSRYDLTAFTKYRRLLDPYGVLANNWVDALFPPL